MLFRPTVAILVAITMIATSCVHKSAPVAVNDPVTSAEKRAPSSNLADTPWTTWSEKGTIGGLIVLSHIRENLLKTSLHDSHVNYSGYAHETNCTGANVRFRTADGVCNNLKSPLTGAAGTAFGRNVAPQFIDKDAADKLMTPNPGLVSKEFFTRDEFKPVPFLNMLAAVWIQFMNHDWMTHGPNMKENPYRMQTPDGEKIVDRTADNPANPNQYKSEFGKVSANDVTHWWDASQLYGSSQAQQNALRSFSRGKFLTVDVNGHELLPKRTDFNPADNRQNQGYEATGFKDNWWVGLSMLHTLFVREHNAIADMLLKNYVKYDAKTQKFTWTNGKDVQVLDEKGLDEQIFQTARLINAAVLAKIHTVEWTPAILPNPVLKKAMYTNWYGLANPNTWAGPLKNVPGFRNQTDWFEGTQTGYVIGGIVGDKMRDYGVPFSITEEFVSVYRLHSLLPEKLEIRRMSAKDQVQAIPMAETRSEKSYALMSNYDTKDLFYSFGRQLPGQLVLNDFPKFMQELEVPGHPTLDMGMIDIVRDRERGVPRYNQFRRGIGLKPIRTYKDFFPPGKPLDERQLKIVEKFERIYGKDPNGNDNVELIDLLVGTLAEEVRPKSFGFGETMFQIFILMASRRLMTDRFYTDNYRKEFYTPLGLKWIDDSRFSQVIVRHMPELKSSVEGLETAFLPWKK